MTTWTTRLALLIGLASHTLHADDVSNADLFARHSAGSSVLADDQDELAADVQQLVTEQTVPQVIELFGEVEKIMDEATDRLAKADTGGETMAAQTEIIEKIHAAAQERQKQNGSGDSGSAMMDMMERMMGEKSGEGKGKPGGKKPGDQAGNGAGGKSDTDNDETNGNANGTGEVRRVPKAAGSAGREIPNEFKKAFDAYNRGVEEKLK